MGCTSRDCPASRRRISCNEAPPGSHRRPTVTLKRAFGNLRRRIDRAIWTEANEMNPSGCTSASADHIAQPHAGIDQHLHRTQFQQRQYQRYKIDPRPHQQRNSHPGFYAKLAQTCGNDGAIGFELRKRNGAVTRRIVYNCIAPTAALFKCRPRHGSATATACGIVRANSASRRATLTPDESIRAADGMPRTVVVSMETAKSEPVAQIDFEIRSKIVNGLTSCHV